MPPDEQAPRPSIWTPQMITAIGGALAVVLTALGALLMTLQGMRNDAKVAAEEAAKQQQIVVQKTFQIHELANSNLNRSESKLAVANAKIEGLEKAVLKNADDKKVADELAAKAVVP